jgi:hypothetical protein
MYAILIGSKHPHLLLWAQFQSAFASVTKWFSILVLQMFWYQENELFVMRLFHPLYSLGVTQNLWLFINQNLIDFKFSQKYIKKGIKILGFEICAYFFLLLQWLPHY